MCLPAGGEIKLSGQMSQYGRLVFLAALPAGQSLRINTIVDFRSVFSHISLALLSSIKPLLKNPAD